MHLLNARILFRAWCHLALLAMVQAALSPELSPVPDPSPDPIPQPIPEPGPIPAADSNIIPAVPVIMGWLGSIGGVLGIISFTETYITRLVKAIIGPPKPEPEYDYAYWKAQENKHYGYKEAVPKKDPNGEAPWMVGVQVGSDGQGLEGAEGEFPQFCLWDRHGELVGYNDQTIHILNYKNQKADKYNFEDARQDMPAIPRGGLTSLGIWPAPGHEDLHQSQVTYVTMVKRHFDAICVAQVFLKWFDDQTFLFDGTWARASNMSWYYSFVWGHGPKNDGVCFWLDSRGDLKHTKDLEEEYIGNILGKTGNKHYPSYLWASKVRPESGIPEGDDLTDSMRENGVHEYKVPMGVKFHAPAFRAGEFNLDSLNVSDFVHDPGRLHWIMEPSRMTVRGGNPVLPILHPSAKLSDKNPELVWEDAKNKNIPIDCMTDLYYDKNDKLVEPGSGRRCSFLSHDRIFAHEFTSDEFCRDKPKHPRAFDNDSGANRPLPPLHERHSRTLVNDQNHRSRGNGVKELCGSPHSVGPSYANHRERWFCRMTDKTLWPFCDTAAGVSHDCFDAEAEILVEKNKPLGKRAHQWDVIEDWHSEKRFKRAA